MAGGGGAAENLSHGARAGMRRRPVLKYFLIWFLLKHFDLRFFFSGSKCARLC